jgi:glycerol uptake facilitator protein
MTAFIGELIGTGLLVTLGQGVVANVVLQKTKGNNSGWIVIGFGWAIAVFVGVFCASAGSKAHLNPAVTLAFALRGSMAWSDVPTYLGGQMLGAMVGSVVAWLCYRPHFGETSDANAKLAVFATGPAIRRPLDNFLAEAIGTFVLVLGIMFIALPSSTLGALDALPVGLLILGIGLSLGGPTGYAINPARDLGPRIMHAILPIPGKRDSDWGYAWIPVIAPLAGAALAVLVWKLK